MKQDNEIVQQEVKATRQALMLRAKECGIKNFRILNKEELKQVLRDSVTDDEIQKTINGAIVRWKSGWGSKKVKNES